jgi:hypothetical protein
MNHFLQLWECVVCSVSDPGSLNLDPDLGILLNLYLDPGCC